MNTNSAKEAETNRDLPNSPARPNFEQKAYALIDKFGLRDGILHVNQVVVKAREFIRQHHLPDTFTDDEANLSLILGCSQKLIESTDPYYKARVDSLAKRLVSRSVPKGILDEEELWGSSSDRAALDDDKTREYVEAKTDPEATRQFVEKFKEEIDRCKEVWKSKGYDLDIQVYIVDDTVGEFQSKTRSQAYVEPPDREKLSDPNYKPVFELVMLKGHSAEKTDLIKHELYHIEDFFDFQRRGYQEGIFELLDELHTEHAVGNYTPNHSKDPFNSSGYYTAKQLWDRVSFLGDLDFNLIADRKLTLDTVIEKFGLEGLVDFALMYAHTGGKVRTFETFYANPERAVLAMLVDRDKLNLLKGHKSGVVSIDISQIQEGVASLTAYMTPTGQSWNPRYRSLYDLVPSQHGEFWAARPFEESYTTLIDNEQMKRVINLYTRALALAELSSQDVLLTTPEAYTQVRDALVKVPFRRPEVDFSPEREVDRNRDNYLHLYPNEDEYRRQQVRSFYHGLVYDIPQVELAFNLNHPDIRQFMLAQFFDQLDQLAEYAQRDNSDLSAFIMGMYGSNLPFEIREASANHLSEKYPPLKPLFEAVKQVYDSRSLSNRG